MKNFVKINISRAYIYAMPWLRNLWAGKDVLLSGSISSQVSK
jgi:hypothetical protein